MKERLAQFLAAEGLSRNDFANQIGVQRSNITHILDGRNKPSFDFIEKMLITYPQINADWLLLGHGSMYKTATMGSLFPTEPTVDQFTISQGTKPISKVEKSSSLSEETQQEIVPPSGTNLNQQSSCSPITSKQVERIIILYSDKSFDSYHP